MDRDESRLREMLSLNSKEQRLVEIEQRGRETEVEDRLDKANEDLRAAELMRDSNLFSWAVACAYYAMYHSTLAALANLGFRAYTHSVAIEAFEIMYTRRGRLPDDLKGKIGRARQLSHEYVELIRSIKTARERSQYEVYRTSCDDAEQCISDARAFVLALEEHLAPVD